LAAGGKNVAKQAMLVECGSERRSNKHANHTLTSENAVTELAISARSHKECVSRKTPPQPTQIKVFAGVEKTVERGACDPAIGKQRTQLLVAVVVQNSINQFTRRQWVEVMDNFKVFEFAVRILLLSTHAIVKLHCPARAMKQQLL
jgi:hypothetical protein